MSGNSFEFITNILDISLTTIINDRNIDKKLSHKIIDVVCILKSNVVLHKIQNNIVFKLHVVQRSISLLYESSKSRSMT